jgi:hypothetical protein
MSSSYWQKKRSNVQTQDVLPRHKINKLTPSQEEAIAFGLRKYFKVEDLKDANWRINYLLKKVERSADRRLLLRHPLWAEAVRGS